jgi:DNA replication and repair protein RecF
VHLDQLWLTDFRSYSEAEFAPAQTGITVVTGANGEGKTNLIEAVAYLATLRSMRGSPAEAMVRSGAEGNRGIVRALGHRQARRVLIEAEIHAVGRDRVQVNGQALRRTRDLLGALQVTVFSPDDLMLVKGGPQGRRDLLDDLLVALHPRHDAVISEVERVIRQRNALLKSATSAPGGAGRAARAGRDLPDDVRITLDVWDSKLAAAGEELAAARDALVGDLSPLAGQAYAHLAATAARRGRDAIGLAYRRSWPGSLAAALAEGRADDLRRGVTTVGPHRDELDLHVGGLAARTHASQGEQRTLALALRLAGHGLVTDTIGSAPILLLDDVFSELDPGRSEALLDGLPPGQAILTTAGEVPASAEVTARYRVEDGKILS